MALKKSKSLRTSIFLIIFCGLQALTIAQGEVITLDSVFTKMFDADLMPVKSASLLKSNKPIIFVSTSHCSGCVKYFAKGQKNYQFIFLMNNQSLVEVERIINFYKLKGKTIYFTTEEYVKNKKNTFCSGPTPIAIYNCNNQTLLLHYASLNSLSHEFTLKHTALIDNFKRCKIQ